jgi:hypothetical protein
MELRVRDSSSRLRKQHNNELHNFNSSQGIIRVIKPSRVRQTWDMKVINENCVHKEIHLLQARDQCWIMWTLGFHEMHGISWLEE